MRCQGQAGRLAPWSLPQNAGGHLHGGTMRTPDAFHLPSNSAAAPTRSCELCGKRLRGNQRRFCCDAHRWSATANVRQTVLRVGELISRRGFIRTSLEVLVAASLHLEASPESIAARRTYTSSVLDELDLLLLHRGPQDREVRSQVRLRAEAIKLSLELEPSRTHDDQYHYIHALEILRDVGVDDQSHIKKLIDYAWRAVRFYHAGSDLLRLGRALQSLACVYRLDQDGERNARRMAGYAWNILGSREFINSTNPAILTVVHQTAFWYLRLKANYIDGDVVDER